MDPPAAGKRVLSEIGVDDAVQTVKTFAHIGGAAIEIETEAGGGPEHLNPPGPGEGSKEATRLSARTNERRRLWDIRSCKPGVAVSLNFLKPWVAVR